MKNTFGNNLSVTLFGESHGEAVGAVLDGLSPGMPVDEERIREKMEQRKAVGRISTQRHETDEVRIVSGVYRGFTTGTPLCVLIRNENAHSGDYSKTKDLARPGHADLTAQQKYHGFQDPRGGGHFSGRLTAPLVAAGAVLSRALENKGIYIGTHILRCAAISDASFSEDLKGDIQSLNGKAFAVLDERKGETMRAAIETAAQEKDSVGGVLETAVIGMPAGIGEPWFDSVESLLSHALFGIPAVKGVEFGTGFPIADLRGSEANDPFCIKNGGIQTVTNHNGGINGGITNGMPILFRTAVKPTPSIGIRQQTVEFKALTEQEIEIAGRHDPAIVHRARAVVDAVTALVLADLLLGRFGADYFGGD